jgi:IS5 family transposase
LIRSERMLVEQLRYKLLFRWFVGLGMNEEVWHATVFTKNRDRLLAGEVAREIPGGSKRVTLAAAAYNLVRMRNPLAATA